MKYKKIKIIPETQEEYISRIECSGCKKEIHNNDTLISEMSDITFHAEIGDFFKSVYSLDLCSNCFLHKVKPTLENLGFEFNVLHGNCDSFFNDLKFAKLEKSDE